LTAARGLQRSLRELLGADGLLTARRTARPFSQITPALSGRGSRRGAAALVAQVLQLLSLCHARRVAWCARGNTSYCGGATADESAALVLSLRRLNRIRSLEAGTTRSLRRPAACSRGCNARRRSGPLLPLSLGAEAAARSRNLSTNAAGERAALRMMRDLVLGLEWCWPTGAYCRAVALRKDKHRLRRALLFLGRKHPWSHHAAS